MTGMTTTINHGSTTTMVIIVPISTDSVATNFVQPESSVGGKENPRRRGRTNNKNKTDAQGREGGKEGGVRVGVELGVRKYQKRRAAVFKQARKECSWFS